MRDFSAPGFPGEAPTTTGLPVVHATAMPEGCPADQWPDGDVTRLLDWRFANGKQLQSVEHHPELGYRMFGAGHGVHVVSAAGTEISAFPQGAEPWVWQRYMVGQVLPLVSLLHGYELLHASAVSVAGRGVAFLAESGVGKTSIAVNLILRGARLLGDDVAILGLDAGRPVMHPGIGLLNLRRHEADRLDAAGHCPGNQIASTPQGVRVAVMRQPRPTPLRALYLLERGYERDLPRFEEVEDVDFALLAANTFSRYLSTPQRWVRQLEIFAAIASHARMYRLLIPATMNASELAAHIERSVLNELV